MPTVLFILGWRFFFYFNEGNEPPHIHVKKAEKNIKFWLLEDEFDVRLAYSYNCSPRDLRIVRKILFHHFEDLVAAWHQTQGRP